VDVCADGTFTRFFFRTLRGFCRTFARKMSIAASDVAVGFLERFLHSIMRRRFRSRALLLHLP